MASRIGSPNKNRSFLLNRLKDMYGEDFDPIIRAAESAVLISELARESYEAKHERAIDDLKMSVDAWEKIGQYTSPKLRSVEVSQDPDGGGFILKVERVVVDAKSTD